MRQSQILIGIISLLSVVICAFPAGAQETLRRVVGWSVAQFKRPTLNETPSSAQQGAAAQ
jgi:hypothetical protein